MPGGGYCLEGAIAEVGNLVKLECLGLPREAPCADFEDVRSLQVVIAAAIETIDRRERDDLDTDSIDYSRLNTVKTWMSV